MATLRSLVFFFNSSSSSSSSSLHNCRWSYQLLLLLVMLLQVTALQQYFDLSPSENITQERGSSLQIPCKVKNRQGECLWLHNGVGIGFIRGKYEFKRTPDNGDCGLTIYNLSLDLDEGDWQCQVTAASLNEPTLQSSVIHLQVLIRPERPSIKRTNVYTNDLQVLVGAENTIECSVNNGNPSPKISWLLNGKNITQYAETIPMQNPKTRAWSVISKLNSYQIQRNENKANLTCYSEHVTGNQFDTSILTVFYRPVVSVPQKSYSVMEDVPLKIECTVDTNPKATVVWRKVGSNVPIRQSNIGSSTESNVLQFDKASRSLDGTSLECVANNEYGTSEPAVVNLSILYTPHLLNTSGDVQTTTGSPAKLYCNYEGNPKPMIKWYHTNPRTGETSLVPNHGRVQSVLEIENATYSHEGEYHCEAINQINNQDYVVRSSHMLLDVYGLPAFLTKSPYNTEGTRGGQSRVSLMFCSDPPPNNVYWRFGSIQLDALNRPANLSLPGRYTVKPITPLTSKRNLENPSNCFDSTLLIKDTDATDERDYFLVIQNERGSQEGIVKLRVVTPLSPTLLIAITLSIIIVIVIISMMLFMMKKKRKDADSIRDHEEAKEDAQALSQVTSSGKKSTGGSNGPTGGLSKKDSGGDVKNGPGAPTASEKHELVYANLDFTDQNESTEVINLKSNGDTSSVNANGSNSNNKNGGSNGKPIVPRAKPKAAKRNSPNSSKLQNPPVQQLTIKQQQSQLNKGRIANSTEYAQIAFSDKTDL